MKYIFASLSAFAAGVVVAILTKDGLASTLAGVSVVSGFGALDHIINTK